MGFKKSKTQQVVEITEPIEKYYNKSVDESFDSLGVSKDGLRDETIAERYEKYGKNVLAEGKKKNAFIVFLEQFKDLLVLILIIAAIISAVTGGWESTLVIVAVIILNAILGTVQHIKAEKSLESLKALSAPSAKVLRNGVVTVIPSADIVPGDIVILEAGDLVVADGRIINNYSLQVNESSLTGESTAVEKTDAAINENDVALGDQKNMVFSGSLVTYGRATVLVTATGMSTEIGKIAALMNRTQAKKTPLQVSLDKFSKVLAISIMGICLLVFGLSLWRQWGDSGSIMKDVLNSLMFAVALAVAAIPEALSSIVTIVQAVGTQKMAKQNAIIKDLKAVESLGAVSIICSDKTGTLTQNKMTAKQVFIDGRTIDGEAIDKENKAEALLLHAMILAQDSTNQNNEEIGDPTEIALTNLGKKHNIDEVEYRVRYPRLSEIAFDSDRKLMSTLHNIDDGNIILTKGAYDVILRKADKIITANGIREITDEDIKLIERANLEMSRNGLRVLSFACKMTDKSEISLEDENDLIFVGLVSMMDPPREESIEAVKDARIAGIKPIMITGDHKITASAIARQIGIMQDNDEAVEGLELDAMSNEELYSRLEKISVYARVSPEHKIRIVEAWQKKGNIVAMTGDGVNDAPALKQADIGVAMGITGTEVSKDAADMILTDDNFATIVKSVTNGRNVYTNIKNAIAFLLSGNMAGILCILITSIAGLTLPFEAVHLLFINLLTDSLPAIAIGMEPASGDLLLQKPRNPKESILNREILISIGLQGLLICAFTMGAYGIGYHDPKVAATMAFATMTLARLFHGFNCRGKYSVFKLGFKSNVFTLYAFGVGVALLACVIFIPGINSLFQIARLSGADIGFIVLFAFCPTIIIQLFKLVREVIFKAKENR